MERSDTDSDERLSHAPQTKRTLDALGCQRLVEPAAGVPAEQPGDEHRLAQHGRRARHVEALAAGDPHEVLGAVGGAEADPLDLEEAVDRRVAGHAQNHAGHLRGASGPAS